MKKLLLFTFITFSLVSCKENTKSTSLDKDGISVKDLDSIDSELPLNEMKTVKRPDGITMKYFNPSPVVIADSHDAGLAVYKNVDTNQLFLTITVLFKKEEPTELSGDLIIQTKGTEGLSLSSVWHKLINMNGLNVATSMYLLTDRDINELKINPIKLISFTAYNQPVGLNLTKNKNLVIDEISELLK